MLDTVNGLDSKTALARIDLFMQMIEGKVSDEKELEVLDESMYLKDIAHMPARVKCAVLGWRTLKQILEQL